MSRSANNVEKGSEKFNYYEGGLYDISSFFDFSYYHSKTNVPEINRRCKRMWTCEVKTSTGVRENKVEKKNIDNKTERN